MPYQFTKTEGDKLRTAKADSAYQAIENMTPSQVEAYINTNVTTLASAKTVMIIMAKLLLLLLHEVRRRE